MGRRIGLVIFTSLVVLNMHSQNWDINTLHQINSWDSKFIRNYNKTISQTEPYIAFGIPLSIATIAYLNNDQKLMKDAVYIGTSVAGTLAITYGLKYLINRERPYDRYPEKIHPYSKEHSPSFPSTHTATAFALAASISIKYPKWYIIAPSTLWACSVGISRMNEGVHYPSDVIAGAGIGVGCAVANVYINRWLNKILFGVN